MINHNISKIEKLLQKGVKIPNPQCVEIGAEVDVDRISGDGVVIYSGCKIFGRSTLILRGVKLGYEGPVTIDNCQIGPEVDLNGGFFRQAVFLKKASAGSGSHVREGTILEEEANTAHNVGLKQTILLPFVTLGSLINFCDCFMSGGTSRQDHSEVGSSYIHFNYTPNQDKATPSQIGDVPHGVMLNQRPIFLGGQGGLVGPCRLAFGTTIAAGSICRNDVLEPGRLIFEGNVKSGSVPFIPNIYQNIKRTTLNNNIYIANLIALEHWYTHVRSLFIADDFPEILFDGLNEKLNMAIDERMKRFKALSQKMPDSIEAYKNFAKDKASALVLQQKQELYDRWTELEASFGAQRNMAGKDELRDEFCEKIRLGIKTWGKDYIAVIKGLQADDAEIGTRWLQGIVDAVTAEAFKLLPSFRSSG
jgi:UDP-N-acetylglucosamine/UDP-N-acetylgalactosamine diphosphorylase